MQIQRSHLFTWGIKKIGLIIILLVFVEPVYAHVNADELEKLLKSNTYFVYLLQGFLHIIPLGFDHILFVLSLFLLSPKLKPMLWQATTFTIAHSFTLGLTMYHLISPPVKIVEPLIALSILIVALENIFSPKLRPARLGIVFIFGLIHGLGFANALNNIGLPKNDYFSCLILFNLGVELGQITIILLAYFFLAKWFSNKSYYRKIIVIPLSILIAGISFFWFFERLFL